MLILNLFDVNAPVIQGLPDVSREDTIREVKRLTGRAVGINLEPLEPDAASAVETNGEWNLTSGRAATVANARKAIEMGVDFIVLTGNPGVGVTNAAITHTLRKFREEFGDRIMLIAGKMHAAGILAESGENIIGENDVSAFAEAGADVILMPAPICIIWGIPGMWEWLCRKISWSMERRYGESGIHITGWHLRSTDDRIRSNAKRIGVRVNKGI